VISVITYTIDFAIFGRRLRNCGTIHSLKEPDNWYHGQLVPCHYWHRWTTGTIQYQPVQLTVFHECQQCRQPSLSNITPRTLTHFTYLYSWQCSTRASSAGRPVREIPNSVSMTAGPAHPVSRWSLSPDGDGSGTLVRFTRSRAAWRSNMFLIS